MTVDEYRSRFHQLSRYASSLIPIEEDRCRRFTDGLNHAIRKHVVAMDYEGFNSLVEKAMRVEEVVQEESGSSSGKRSGDIGALGESSGRSIKKGTGSRGTRDQSQSGRGSNRPQQSQQFQKSMGTPRGTHEGYSGSDYPFGSVCSRCGESHTGYCPTAPRGTCFYCHQPGHFKKDCPVLAVKYHRRGETSGQGDQGGNYTQNWQSSQSAQRGGSSRGRRASGSSGSRGGRGGGRQTQESAQARVYVMTGQEVEAAPETIAGIVIVFGREIFYVE